MAVFNNLGDTIEGEAVDFDGRAIHPQGAKKHPLTKKTMKLFTTDRNSHAVVRKAGVEPVDEDVKAATAHFHRDVDDKVTADIQDQLITYDMNIVLGNIALNQYGCYMITMRYDGKDYQLKFYVQEVK